MRRCDRREGVETELQVYNDNSQANEPSGIPWPRVEPNKQRGSAGRGKWDIQQEGKGDDREVRDGQRMTWVHL